MVYVGVYSLAVLIDSCYQQSLSEVGVSLHHHKSRRPYPKCLTLFLECSNILAILPFFKFTKVRGGNKLKLKIFLTCGS